MSFFEYSAEPFEDFDEAVSHFMDQVPQIASELLVKVREAYKLGEDFTKALDAFMEVCRRALDPQIEQETVEEMLVQHMLTERIIRKVFDEDFVQHNPIAFEVEQVITVLTSRHLNRVQFLGPLDNHYKAIEMSATNLREKPDFIDEIYERFFQRFSVRIADTHGIVYTPKEVVDFMCVAVHEALMNEFNLNLGDEGVEVIDPCTGTGKYVVNLIQSVSQSNPRALRSFYQNRLFANEVLLMPYYIAGLRIEHTYYEITGGYEPFRGLSFVDTLDVGRSSLENLKYIDEENARRVAKQWNAPINVVIGNPPYNTGQKNENENNKNRSYPEIEKRIRSTYSRDSCATLRKHLYDSYMKFFRWAVDRLEGRNGIVCFISNNNFVDGFAFDGFRKHMLEDFTRVWHLDLSGDMNGGEDEGENVFGSRSSVSVGITLALRNSAHSDRKLFYYRVADRLSTEEKLNFLKFRSENGVTDQPTCPLKNIGWRELRPDKKFVWLPSESLENREFPYGFLPFGYKRPRFQRCDNILLGETIFDTISNGVKTNRDAVVHGFDRRKLCTQLEVFVENYNLEVERYKQSNRPANVDNFVKYKEVDWSRDLKVKLKRGTKAEFNSGWIRTCTYRPFSKRFMFFDKVLVDVPGQFSSILPSEQAQNMVICTSGISSKRPFQVLIVDNIPGHDLLEKTKCFPFYVYDEDGSNQRENITDWAVERFCTQYKHSVSKQDIFFYVYGVLHHPQYRKRYADPLTYSLPRIPLLKDFRGFREEGRRLVRLHLGYESVEPWPLTPKPNWPTKHAGWTVDTMSLNKDELSLVYNDELTLVDIPDRAFRYRLGKRSAIEWIIDQYRVTKERNSEIERAPNAWSEDEQYIVNLVARVITVSMATVKIVDSLAGLPLLSHD